VYANPNTCQREGLVAEAKKRVCLGKFHHFFKLQILA
jgi:hypothetical protein